jgi:CheY-like chemotaxis protein
MDLSEVVSDLAKMIQRIIGEHITFNIHSEPGLKLIRADKGQVEQILMNLCVNARDAMEKGGTLTLETSNTHLDEEFCRVNSWARPGRYVVLSVTDTGCGMDSETKRRVFEPFFTTKEQGKGTGLGLATVFGIVRQHNGMVNVYSEVGVGTTFRIYFPMTEAAETAQDAAPSGPPAGGTETVLLADDDESVCGVAAAMLRKAGYTVLAAGDGEEAVRIFEEHADEIDLALLDVVMPGLGGEAVSEHLQQRRPRLPVLFASGYSSGGIHSGFVLDEGVQFIQKPYQRDVLLRRVREVLDSSA